MKEQIVKHKLYQKINSEDALRFFMEAHIFCVWDFQCLLKVLQQHFTCTVSPWIPSEDNDIRRFINEIVLGEESDIHPNGGYASHFELYLDAMKEAGADTTKMEQLLTELKAGKSIQQILDSDLLTPEVRDFLSDTFACIDGGKIHEVAAYFTYGREDLIPAMFTSMVETITQDNKEQWKTFLFYLERHIEVDEEDHGPLSRKMLEIICRDDKQKQAEAEAASQKSLQSRLKLWDALASKLA